MRTMMIIAACLFGGMLFAQESNVDYFKKGDLVKGIFYYDNGVIQQEGTYKDGKLHGQWIAYDRDGKKNAVAYYHEGQKTGKWFFYQDNKLLEVDYDYNKIAQVTTYKNETIYAIDE